MIQSFESDQSGTVVEVLDALSQTGRFSLTCQFLSSAEKAEVDFNFGNNYGIGNSDL